MPQVRVGWRPYVDSGIDTSANAFLTAAGITDTAQKAAVNTLVKDLKRFNLWSKIKAFYPFVGGTANSHKFNLIDPRDLNEAYRLSFSGGWTHSSIKRISNLISLVRFIFNLPQLHYAFHANHIYSYTPPSKKKRLLRLSYRYLPSNSPLSDRSENARAPKKIFRVPNCH